MKLKELVESRMSDAHQDLQEKLMSMFGFGDHDAEDALAFALGESEWEDLSDEVREKLYSHYEKSGKAAKGNSTDPKKFVLPALKLDLGIK